MATINDAVRLMYLNQTGREADPGGLEYFASRFGADSKIDDDELAIFRQMAPAEVAGQEARQAAAAAQQAAVVNQLTSQLTAAGMSPANFYASGGQLPATATGGATTAETGIMTQSELKKAMQGSVLPFTDTTAGMSITQAYQQVLGRTPNAQEIAYWQSQFGDSVDATELSTFSVAAQPERAAVPTTNNAIRQMYLSVLGREPDAAGLKYFYDLFGDEVSGTELDIFKGMTIQEQTANAARNAGATTGATTSLTGTTAGTVQPITRPPPIRQVTSTQLAPASFAQTAIAATPFTNVYTPSTVQQNAPRLSDIQAAAQSANPYQSLMSLTPQRTLSPAYAAQAGQTTANTNLGGYDSSLYSKPLTGLLAPSTVAGGGGADGVNNSGDQRGPGTDNTGSGQTIYGGLANLAGEANRAGFTGLGGFLASGLPVGAAYKGGTLTAADIAALTGKFDIGSSVSLGGTGDGGGGYGSGSGPGGSGTGAGGYGPQYRGGLITPRDVKGPNPPGPDDGHASLDIGEYVIRKSAVKKYGSNIFEQINAGKIPAQRLKSLLE
jgi:hypothetical protein